MLRSIVTPCASGFSILVAIFPTRRNGDRRSLPRWSRARSRAGGRSSRRQTGPSDAEAGWIARFSVNERLSTRLRRDAFALVLDVLEHAAHGRFRGEDVAGRVDRDAFAHSALGRIRLVWRHEDRHLAVLQAAAANALEPARMPARFGLRVGGIEEIITPDR